MSLPELYWNNVPQEIGLPRSLIGKGISGSLVPVRGELPGRADFPEFKWLIRPPYRRDRSWDKNGWVMGGTYTSCLESEDELGGLLHFSICSLPRVATLNKSLLSAFQYCLLNWHFGWAAQPRMLWLQSPGSDPDNNSNEVFSPDGPLHLSALSPWESWKSSKF